MGKGKENKTHIGFYLNLDKPSDRTINHILETIPSYVSKTSYIKRAIMFYKKNCNDNIELADNNFTDDYEDTIQVKTERKPVTKNIKPKTEDKSVSQTNDKNINPAILPVQSNPISKAVEEKITTPKDLEPTEKTTENNENNENDIIINNNSDIDDSVDYDAFVDGFFNS